MTEVLAALILPAFGVCCLIAHGITGALKRN